MEKKGLETEAATTQKCVRNRRVYRTAEKRRGKRENPKKERKNIEAYQKNMR